jgi:hypothetical protein
MRLGNLAIAAVLGLAACGKPAFLYNPGPPVADNGTMANADGTGIIPRPLYPVKAAVVVLADVTGDYPNKTAGQGDGRAYQVNLMDDEGPSIWPRISNGVLTQALAAQLQASGLVESAEVFDDHGTGEARGWAQEKGERLYLTGNAYEATLSYPAADPEKRRYRFTLALKASVIAPPDPNFDPDAEAGQPQPFSGDFWEKTATAEFSGKGEPPAQEINAVLQKLFKDELESLSRSMEQAPVAQSLSQS